MSVLLLRQIAQYCSTVIQLHSYRAYFEEIAANLHHLQPLGSCGKIWILLLSKPLNI